MKEFVFRKSAFLGEIDYVFTYFVKMGRTSGLLPKESIALAVIKNLWCDLFEINCKYNSEFISAYSDVLDMLHWGLSIEEMVEKLKTNIPGYWRWRKRGEAQIAGFLYYKQRHPTSRAEKKRMWCVG